MKQGVKFNIIIRIILILFVYSALTLYIGWNGWMWLKQIVGYKNPLTYYFFIFLIAFSYFIGHFVRKWAIFKIIGSYWIAIFQYSILLFPIADLAGFSLIKLGLPDKKVVSGTGMIITLLFFILFLYGTYQAYSPTIRSFSIVIPKRANQKNLKIAMASDMHFGLLSGVSHVHRLVDNINTLHPDIILLPGDIVDDDPVPFIQKKMGDIMINLHAPLGVYGVLGNHEYYGGKIPAFLKEMERIGIKILQDEKILINNSFYLVGRKDKTDVNRESIEKMLKNVDMAFPIIMMDHQPTELKQAEQNGVDLLLSGHTHRGQMAPNHLFTKRIFELDWGYLKKNQLHTIVSSGFGFWGPPLRIGSRSEIIVIDINFIE